jgi:hypothetical protein
MLLSHMYTTRRGVAAPPALIRTDVHGGSLSIRSALSALPPSLLLSVYLTEHANTASVTGTIWRKRQYTCKRASFGKSEGIYRG